MKRITMKDFAAAAMLGTSLTWGGMAVAQQVEVESDVPGQPRVGTDVESDADVEADGAKVDANSETRPRLNIGNRDSQQNADLAADANAEANAKNVGKAETDMATVVQTEEGRLRVRDQSGTVRTRQLGDDVPVMIDGRKAQLTDIRQGDRVRFVTDANDGVSRVVVMRDSAVRPGQPGAAQQEGVFLGVRISESPTTGVYVRDVMEGGPAAQGGIQARDYILSVNGEKVESPQEFDQKMSQLQVGNQAKFEIWRNQQKQQVSVNLATRQSVVGVARPGLSAQNRNLAQQPNQFNGSADRRAAFRPEDQGQPRVADQSQENEQAWLGVQLRDAAPAREGEPQDEREGVLITDIYPSGPAARFGLRQGDMLVRIADQQVGSAEEVARLIGQQKPGESVSLVVLRNDQEQAIDVTLGNRDDFLPANRFEPEDRFGGNSGNQQNRANFGGEFQNSVYPEHAMMLEQHRRFAEQHERIERSIMELRQEVQQLRQEIRGEAAAEPQPQPQR